MQLIDHVSIAVTDLSLARPFYDAIMQALGCEKVYDRKQALGYGERCRAHNPNETYLAVYESETMHANFASHWCFKAASAAQVEQFHAAGLATGGSDDGIPGLRPSYHPHYYAAFLIDPSGNRLEAVYHNAPAN